MQTPSLPTGLQRALPWNPLIGCAPDLFPDVGPSVSGAVWNPLDAHQDTRLLVRHLVRGFEAAGGTVFAPSRVAAIDASANACRGVTLTNGDVVASPRVIVSAGPWSNDLRRSDCRYRTSRPASRQPKQGGTIPAGPRRSGTIPVPRLSRPASMPRACQETTLGHSTGTWLHRTDRRLSRMIFAISLCLRSRQ